MATLLLVALATAASHLPLLRVLGSRHPFSQPGGCLPIVDSSLFPKHHLSPVYSGCSDRIYRLNGLHNINVFLTVLEAGNLRSGYQGEMVGVLVRAFLLAFR